MVDNLIVVLSTISNIIVAVSVIFLWLQVKEMKRQIQSSTYQSIVHNVRLFFSNNHSKSSISLSHF